MELHGAALDALRLLDLPHPDTVAAIDGDVAAAYARFAATLRVSPDGAAISCDEGVLDLRADDPSRAGPLGEQHRPILCLAAALALADEEDVQTIRDQTWQHEDWVGGGIDIFASCIGEPVHALLTAHVPAGTDRPLALWAGGSPMPGSSWSRGVSARRWNADWAVLVSAAGGWGDPREVFPVVLGYARLDRMHRAVAGLLADQTEFAIPPPDDANSEGCTPWQENLLVLCWSRFPEDGERYLENYGPVLLGLSDERLAKEADAQGGLLDDRFLAAVDRLVRWREDRRRRRERSQGVRRGIEEWEWRLRVMRDRSFVRSWSEPGRVFRDLEPDQVRDLLFLALEDESTALAAVWAADFVLNTPAPSGSATAAIGRGFLGQARTRLRGEDAEAVLRRALAHPSPVVQAAADEASRRARVPR
jgi:hypothetical protein